MKKKRCTQCKRLLPLSMFHEDRSKKDGRREMCSECRKVRTDKYRFSEAGVATEERRIKSTRIQRDVDEEYAERRREIVSKSSARPEYREKLRQKESSPHGLLKKRATGAVDRAIARGDLVRPDKCEECGDRPGEDRRGRSKIRAYHYLGHEEEHRLDVRWLCPRCLNRITIGMEPMLDRKKKRRKKKAS